MPNEDSSRTQDRRDWLRWCEEKPIRVASRKDALLSGHISYSAAVRRWLPIYCQACRTRHI
jgi:hypothetical protein